MNQNQELRACVEALEKTQSKASIGQAFAEYARLVWSIADDYDNTATVQELRAGHPDLDFMEDDELEEVLAQASVERVKRAKKDKPEPMKVAGSTDPNSLARAIASTVREGTLPTLQAIGAGAVNQANKAVIIANGMLAPNGIELVIAPIFQDLKLGGQEQTGVRLRLRQMG